MKKSKIVILIVTILIVLYFIIWTFGATLKVFSNNSRSLEEINTSLAMNLDDSLNFCNDTKQNFTTVYSNDIKGANHFTLIKYKKYNLIVRNISEKRTDFNRFYKISFDENTVDNFISYDIEDIAPFYYKIALNRKHKQNVDLTIKGKVVRIVKRTEDSLQLHGQFYSFSLGKNNMYVNEGIYVQDEGLFSKPVEADVLFVNKKNGVNLLLIYSNEKSGAVPLGITNELN